LGLGYQLDLGLLKNQEIQLHPRGQPRQAPQVYLLGLPNLLDQQDLDHLLDQQDLDHLQGKAPSS